MFCILSFLETALFPCGWGQNSLAMDFLMEQLEVLRSDALPDNNQQCRHYWNLGDDGSDRDLNPRPRPCSQMHLTTRPPRRHLNRVSSSFTLYCLSPRLSAPHYLLSSVYCGQLGSAVYHDQNSLVMDFDLAIEVLHSDALPTTSNVDTTGTSVTTGRSGIWTPDLGLAVKRIWTLRHPAVVTLIYY